MRPKSGGLISLRARFVSVSVLSWYRCRDFPLADSSQPTEGNKLPAAAKLGWCHPLVSSTTLRYA
jgi:hypothetical protein